MTLQIKTIYLVCAALFSGDNHMIFKVGVVLQSSDSGKNNERVEWKTKVFDIGYQPYIDILFLITPNSSIVS